jgi:hypothetical protein
MDDLKNVIEIIAAIATAISCIFAIMASRAAYRAPENIPGNTGEHKKEFQLISKKRLWIGVAVFFCFVAVILFFILASSLRQKGKVSGFSGNISFDAGVMNVVWRNPFSWTPAVDKRISLKFISDHYSLNAHEDFKVEQGNTPNKGDIMSIRGIDTEAKNTLLYAFDDFENWGQPYWPRLGIAKVFGVPDDMRVKWPLFSDYYCRNGSACYLAKKQLKIIILQMTNNLKLSAENGFRAAFSLFLHSFLASLLLSPVTISFCIIQKERRMGISRFSQAHLVCLFGPHQLRREYELAEILMYLGTIKVMLAKLT